MPKGYGYCSYCRVPYANLDQHLFSPLHRLHTRHSRRRLYSTGLMERFLQDVIRHHPHYSEENGSAEIEDPENPDSPDVVVVDEFFPEDTDDDDFFDFDVDADPSDFFDDMYSNVSDTESSVADLDFEPSDPQEGAGELVVRPSVIQKLEQGQQQSLEVALRIMSGEKGSSSLGSGQPTESGKGIIRPPVICNAPASLPSCSSDSGVVAGPSSRLVLAVSSDSFPRCDTEPAESEEEPKPSSHDQDDELVKQPVCQNLAELIPQNNSNDGSSTLAPVAQFHELNDAALAVEGESSPESAAVAAADPNPANMPSDPEMAAEASAEHHEELHSDPDADQEENAMLFQQQCSVSSKVDDQPEYDDQPECGPSQGPGQDSELCQEKWVDDEGESYEARASEVSFDCGSSCHSLFALSDMLDTETDAAEENHAGLQHADNTSDASAMPLAHDSDDSLQEVASHFQEIAEEAHLQNTNRTSLVDESYNSSGSEVNYDADDSLQSTEDSPPKSERAVSHSRRVHNHLVDPSYGYNSQSDTSDEATPACDEPPVVRRKRLRKKTPVSLVDESYGSSSSEASSDSDTSLDHPQTSAKGRKPKGRPVHLKHKKHRFSNVKARLDCDVSLETVADESRRDVADINPLQEENADLEDMNCESRGPDMGFHAGASLVADQSPVAVEVNPQEVDNDLDNESVHSSISNLSFDSHAYRSPNDQPQGALGEVNLNELNVDVEVKSYGCSSSELTFDSDSPLLSVTERSQLDVERLYEDDINVEDENCESSSSDITFDSDIPNFSLVEKPQVAVYEEEEPVDLENKSNESCVSEITFDSDIPLHSGNDQPEVAVEVIIQEDEYVHLERKKDTPSDCEISLNSYVPLHSVTNPSEVAVQKINSRKEDQIHMKNQDNEPSNSELTLDSDISHPEAGHLEDPINDINFREEEYVNLQNKSNELSVSETRLSSDNTPPLQSVIRKCEVIVRNTWLPKEKHAELAGKSVERSDSEVSSKPDVSHAVTEPRVGAKKREKKKHIEKKSNEHDSSDLDLNFDVLSQLVMEGHIDPAGFETNFSIEEWLRPVTYHPQLTSRKKKHVDVKDIYDQPSCSYTSFNSVAYLQSLPEQEHKVIEKMNHGKEDAISPENKTSEPSGSKVLSETDVSSQSSVAQGEVAVKQTNLENKEQMCLANKNSQCNYSETNSDSDFLVQPTCERPLEQPEHIELEPNLHNQSCESEDSPQPIAEQLSESSTKTSLWKDKDIDREAKGLGITYDSEVLQPVACHTEVIQINPWKEEHVDLEKKTVESSVSEVHFDSDEELHPVTNTTQEPLQEMNGPRLGHTSLNKGYEPHGSEIIYGSNVPLHSVIQPPQTLQKEHASSEVSNKPCPKMSFVSNDPCQSVSDNLKKPIKKRSLKEDHVYLEDKSYKLVDFEATYDSDVPVQFVTEPSVVDESLKEVASPKQDQNELENDNYQPCSSGVRYDSDVHLQSEVDSFQVTCKETNQKKEFLDMEEKSNEPSDSEMMYASDVSFQIVVNQCQTSDGESDSPQLVIVDVASDSDCDREVISDPPVSLQLETDPPQMTIKEMNDLNAESVVSSLVGNHHCGFCGCKLRYDIESSPQSAIDQSKESFKIINRKNDYIILGDSTCQSCGHEINFSVDSSDPSLTYQSQGPEENYIELNCSKGNFTLEDTCQPMTHQVQQADEDTDAGLLEPSVCAVNHPACTVSVIRQTKHPDLETGHAQSCDSGLTSQHDASLQSSTVHPQEGVQKTRRRKRVTFDRTIKSYVIPKDSTYIFDSRSNLEQIEYMKGDLEEPVLEASPYIPPSCGRKTWPQMQEDDGDSEAKKVLLDEEGTTPWSDPSQDTTSIHCPLAGEDCDDLPGVSGRPCFPPPAEGLHEQHWQVASQSQMETAKHKTQTSCTKPPPKKRKMAGQEESSPKRKRLQSGIKGKKKLQIHTEECPPSQTQVLEPKPKPLDSLISAFNSLSIQPKEGEPSNSPEMNRCISDDNLQSLHRCKPNTVKGSSHKSTVIKPPRNQMKPDLRKGEVVDTALSPSAGETANKGKNLASPERAALRLRRTSQPSASLENSENVNAGEIPKDNFQLTLSSHDGAKTSPKSVRNEFRKEKICRRKMTSDQSHFTKSVYKAVMSQQETRLAAEKLAAWIQMKASDVIRKYVSGFSGVPRPLKHPSRITRMKMQLRQSLARRVNKAEGPTETLVNSSVPPAGAEEQVVAVASPPPEPPPEPEPQPVEPLPSPAEKKHRKYQRRKKKRTIPVRAYDLRSSCYIPDNHRMVTRLASKLRGCNEVK